MISNGRIISTGFDENKIPPKLRIEINIIDHWGQCLMTFNEKDSYMILEKIGDQSDPIKDPKSLLDKEVLLLDHPKGGTLAPIALKKDLKDDWIYKEKYYEP